MIIQVVINRLFITKYGIITWSLSATFLRARYNMALLLTLDKVEGEPVLQVEVTPQEIG